jgi:cytochrome c
MLYEQSYSLKSISTNKLVWLFFAVIFAVFVQSAVDGDMMAAERATKEECVAFVKKAIEYVKTNGSEKAFTEFSDPKGKFIDRDLYIIVYDSTGLTLAHGRNNKLVGRNRLDEQDADGTYFNRERIELMKTQTSFWTHYKITDPLTHKILPKLAYCEVMDDAVLKRLLICSGVYDAEP